MGLPVYVDVLLVLNYIVNLLLVLCSAKISGVLPQRRKIVAAALVGSLCSLTIFLPFMGFFYDVAAKALTSALMVRVAFPYISLRGYLGQWFIFFAVSFFFAGVILGIWMTIAPQGMMYYNGIVYFHISPLFLIAATVTAYLLLTLLGRMGKSSRLRGNFCKVEVYLGGSMKGLSGLLDSGNTLAEPFSGAPVMVCSLIDIEGVLPPDAAKAIRAGELPASMRLIPYAAVGGGGLLPAFIPDKLIVHTGGQSCRVPGAYVGVSVNKIGGDGYNAILNPEMVLYKIETTSGGAK